MYKIITTIFLLVFTVGISAQDAAQSKPSNHEISLRIGNNNNILMDYNFSPLHYSGSGISASLSYAKWTKNRNYYNLSINYSLTTIDNLASDYLASINNTINMGLFFFSKIGNSSKKFKMYFGSGIQSNIDYTIYKEDALTYFNLHSINAAYAIRYYIHPKHQFSAKVNLPIVGLLVRPPHTGWDDKFNETSTAELAYTGKWTSLNDFIGLQLDGAYQFTLSPKMDIVVQFNFHYQKTEQPALTKIIHSKLLSGITIKF